MSERLSPGAMLDREFLEIRRRLIDIAASMDRLACADPSASLSTDPRMAQVNRAINSLTQEGTDRAERVQMIFSDAYDPRWRER